MALLLPLFKGIFLFTALEMYLQPKLLMLAQLHLTEQCAVRAACSPCSSVPMRMVCGLGRKLPEMYHKFEDKVTVKTERFLGFISLFL